MQTFISGDQLVGEGKPRHHASLLEPVDGAERAGKEDAFDAGERDQTFGERFRAVNLLV